MARALVMFWREAVGQSGLPSMTKLVGLTLALRMDSDGRAEVSRAVVADLASATTRAVEVGVRRLEVAGLLRVDRTVGGRGFVNRYQAVVPSLNGEQRSLFEAGKRRTGFAVPATETANETTGNGEGRSPVSRRSEDQRARTRARTPPDDAGYSDPANAEAARQAAAEFRARVGAGRPVAKGTGS